MEILSNRIRYPGRDLKPLILFKLLALDRNYRCKELCRQEVTAKLSQCNENYVTQLIYTVTEINVIETEVVCDSLATQFT